MGEVPLSGGADHPGPAAEAQRAAPLAGLWVLEKADALLGEIASALWLVIASVWRVPLLLVRSDGLRQLELGIDARRILPPRLNMLVAAIASALFLVVLLPDRTPHANSNDAIGRLVSASPEQWIIVAAPALIALWLVAQIVTALLRLVVGPGGADPRYYVTYTLSAEAILSCLGVGCIVWFEPWLKSVSTPLADHLVITGLLTTICFLGWTGWSCVRQTRPHPRAGGFRVLLATIIGSISFIFASLAALAATYWLIQAQATVADFVASDPSPSDIRLHSATCFANEDALICGALMTSKTGYSVTGAKSLKVKWDYADRGGPSRLLRVTKVSSPPVIVSPRTEQGSFWSLQAKQPQPLVVRIEKADACATYREMQLDVERVEPSLNVQSLQPRVTVEVVWHGGFALTARDDAAFHDYPMDFVAEDFSLAYSLQEMCSNIS